MEEKKISWPNLVCRTVNKSNCVKPPRLNQLHCPCFKVLFLQALSRHKVRCHTHLSMYIRMKWSKKVSGDPKSEITKVQDNGRIRWLYYGNYSLLFLGLFANLSVCSFMVLEICEAKTYFMNWVCFFSKPTLLLVCPTKLTDTKAWSMSHKC